MGSEGRDGLAMRGLLVVLLVIASASSGLAHEGTGRAPDAAPAGGARPGPPGRPPGIAPADEGPDPSPLPSLHEGTYPVSPPPAPGTASELAWLLAGVNKGPGGVSTLATKDSKSTASAKARPMSGSAIVPLAAYSVEGRFLFEDRELEKTGFTGGTWMAPVRWADVG